MISRQDTEGKSWPGLCFGILLDNTMYPALSLDAILMQSTNVVEMCQNY